MAEAVLDRMVEMMPVTPVPLVAAALLSFQETFVGKTDLLTRLGEYRDHLLRTRSNLGPDDMEPRHFSTEPGECSP